MELLKDVLAFANAFGRDEAFILIGVLEVKGSRAQVVGITDHLDDAFRRNPLIVREDLSSLDERMPALRSTTSIV